MKLFGKVQEQREGPGNSGRERGERPGKPVPVRLRRKLRAGRATRLPEGARRRSPVDREASGDRHHVSRRDAGAVPDPCPGWTREAWDEMRQLARLVVLGWLGLGCAGGVSPGTGDGGSQATVPGAPTGVTAQAGDGAAAVRWTAPASDGGRPISGYQVAVSPPAAGATVHVNATTASVTGLTNGTAYPSGLGDERRRHRSGERAVGARHARPPGRRPPVSPTPRTPPRTRSGWRSLRTSRAAAAARRRATRSLRRLPDRA